MGGGDWHAGRGERRQYDPRDDDRRGGWNSSRGDDRRRSPPRGGDGWRDRSRDRGAAADDDLEACRVWAGGCPSDITEREIKNEFSKFGPVLEVTIKHSAKDTFAFVLYSKESHARDAIDAFDQATVFGGVRIKVAPAKRKSETDPGSRSAGKGHGDHHREERRDDHRPLSRRDDDRGSHRDRDDYTRGYNDRKGEGKGKGKFETRPGDWNCPECNDLQFAKNTQCRKCGAPKPQEDRRDYRDDRYRDDRYRDDRYRDDRYRDDRYRDDRYRDDRGGGKGKGRDHDNRDHGRQDYRSHQGRIDYRAPHDDRHHDRDRDDRGRRDDFQHRGGRDERRQERSRSPRARRRVRVGLENLPADMGEDELVEICQEFGEVQSHDLWVSGRAKHGMVEFRTREEAQKAIQELDNRQIQEWDMRLKAFFSTS